MICHYSYDTVDAVMMHSSDNEAWKYFNRVHH
jgi:hypothetical protein